MPVMLNRQAFERLVQGDIDWLRKQSRSLESEHIEDVLNEAVRLRYGNGIKILDACCGSRMFWFNKQEPHTTYMDIRFEEYELCDGRELVIHPDIVSDCRRTPFEDETFNLVVFDPPHLKYVGERSWMMKKYGRLPQDWQKFLKDSMDELMRVLKVGGTLILKWNEKQIKVSSVLEAISPHTPLFGHPTRRNETTIWMTFMKF